MTSLEPLGENVLVRQLRQEDEHMGSGLILPSAAQKYPEGHVLCVGPKVTDLEAGDRVVFAANSGGMVFVDGGFALLMHQNYIVGKRSRMLLYSTDSAEPIGEVLADGTHIGLEAGDSPLTAEETAADADAPQR